MLGMYVIGPLSRRVLVLEIGFVLSSHFNSVLLLLPWYIDMSLFIDLSNLYVVSPPSPLNLVVLLIKLVPLLIY